MLILHIVFWLLSAVFAVQLYQIRKEQRDLYKRELSITKRLIEDDINIQDHKKKVENRLDEIEETQREILKKMRND